MKYYGFSTNVFNFVLDEKEVVKAVNFINDQTEHFFKIVLPRKLSDNGLITLSHWFAAHRIVKESGIYERNITFLNFARKKGFDVKINMQDYELSYHGKIS